MKDIILSLLGFLFFGAFIVVALWFSAFLLLFIFAASFLLAIYVMIRAYYLRWKYGNSFAEKQQENSNQVGQTTIIDVEYQDISDKK